MHARYLKWGVAFAALAVILGAFGAHSLKQQFSEKVLLIFETGVRYQFYHSIALLISGILYKEYPTKMMVRAGQLFIAGIFLFSGSLYLLTFLNGNNISSFNWVGILTPIGGVLFITGWILLFIAINKKASLSN